MSEYSLYVNDNGTPVPLSTGGDAPGIDARVTAIEDAISSTPVAGGIPQANASGKLDAGWFPTTGTVLRHVSYPLEASGAVAITYADLDFTPEEVPYPFFTLAAGKPYIVSLLTASLTGCTAQICHADGTTGVDVTPYAACGEQVCGDGTVCGQPVTQSIATLVTYIPM